MNQSQEVEQPFKGQKFASFEHLKEYLEEYGQKNYVKFWIRSSHTRHSQKSKISKTMNPDLKYVSVKFACIFGGEKIRCRGSGIRKSYTYRNLGCPCMINAVVGEDGNHVKLDTVILEHNHVLCKTLYDSLKKKAKKKSVGTKDEEAIEEGITFTDLEPDEKTNWLEDGEENMTEFRNDDLSGEGKSSENCLKDIENKYGKIVKVLVINTENENGGVFECKKPIVEAVSHNKRDEVSENQICRLCLSSKDKLSPIFNPSFPLESTVLSFKIMGCASIEISLNDGLPNNICKTCEANLDIAYNFRIQCEKSDSILRKLYARSKIVTKKDSEYEDIFIEDSSSIESNSFPEDNSFLEDNSFTEDNPFPEDNPVGEDDTCSEENSSKFPIICPGLKKEDAKGSTLPVEVYFQEPLFQFDVSCPLCGSEFDAYDSMLEHLGSHTDNETFLLACNICTLVCSSVKNLQNHMREHLEDKRVEKWTCSVCDKLFETAEELKSHEAIHETTREDIHEAKVGTTRPKKLSSVMKYLCNTCGKIFNTKDRFQAHKNIHEGLRPHVCLQCGRGFADRKNLHQHYDVVHLRKVRHECPVCQRKFYTRTKMKSHMTMHSGDKPFTCDVCGKTFRLKMNMNKHKKTHLSERPYQCDKCSAAFLEKNLLRRHSYKHGGVRPYRCPVCGHGFSVKFTLKKHLRDSKCRSVVIADPESYGWVGMGDSEPSLDERKCVVVFKSQETNALQGEGDAIDMKILQG